MKDVNSTFPQPAAVTLYIIRFEKQQVLSNQMRISGGNQEISFCHLLLKKLSSIRLNSGKTPESAISKHWAREENLNVSIMHKVEQ